MKGAFTGEGSAAFEVRKFDEESGLQSGQPVRVDLRRFISHRLGIIVRLLAIREVAILPGDRVKVLELSGRIGRLWNHLLHCRLIWRGILDQTVKGLEQFGPATSRVNLIDTGIGEAQFRQRTSHPLHSPQPTLDHASFERLAFPLAPLKPLAEVRLSHVWIRPQAVAAQP